MVNETQNKPIEQIQKLEQFLPEKKQEELANILAFGEKYKEEGENLKNKFWGKYCLKNFFNLIAQYEESEQKFVNGLSEKEKGIINSLKGISREKFFKEYLTDIILYSGNPENDRLGLRSQKFGKEILQKGWKGKLQPGVTIQLDYDYNMTVEEVALLVEFLKDKVQLGMVIDLTFPYGTGDDGAQAISKIELKEGCGLYLFGNWIGDDGVKAIAKNLRLKEGVELSLSRNENIGKEGYEALASMEMKKGVTLDLSHNDMGNDCAEAISKIKLEEGVILDLSGNRNIGKEGYEALASMEMKKGVTLDLSRNKIGTSGLEAISKMELEEGMTLKLCGHYISGDIIGEEGLKIILNNLKLKDGVTLDLSGNNMPDRMKLKCKDLEDNYKCRILVD